MAKPSKKAENRFRSLIDIGVALTSEKELQKILDLILEKAIATTHADRASLYLTEAMRIDSIGHGKKKFLSLLKFRCHSDRFKKKTLHNKIIDSSGRSIPAYVALQGRTVNVTDVTKLSANLAYRFVPEFDEHYPTKSVLAVPIVNPDGKVWGVLQLLNKLPANAWHAEDATLDLTKISGFSKEDEELMKAFASQALVAMENARLNEDIENLFESFIRASVTAIEARDPSTSGHSDRVAVLTVEFARAVHMETQGTYKETHFSDQQMREIRYASLLHDFGKIGVSESVLQKEKKLYPHELETILLRLDSAKLRKEVEVWRELAGDFADTLSARKDLDPAFRWAKAEKQLEKFSSHIQEVRSSILSANHPQIVAKDFDIAKLMAWIQEISSGLGQIIVTPEEMVRLSIPKGTLDHAERQEIESHVSHTYQFLRQIAWTEDLASVTEIAHAHHEKLDGTGYPRGLSAEFIPLQSRIMAISDIYDALTSMDRPYKPAVGAERALEILHIEALENKIDGDLLRIFIEAGVFKSVEGMRRRRAA